VANLTADRKSIRKDGTIFAYPVAAATTVYAGGLVSLDPTGHAVAAADSAAQTFVGKADIRADNGAGGAGDLVVQGHREGIFEFAAAAMTAADAGADAYVVDDNTVGPGIVAPPVNVTGVVVARTPLSTGGAYALAYTAATTTLAFGGGAGVDVGAGGTFALEAADGCRIRAIVAAGSLPGGDASDTLQLRHQRCGRIAEVASATSVFVDILGAVRR
jgi:hypothetical protein